jgi:hypothetical protein
MGRTQAINGRTKTQEKNVRPDIKKDAKKTTSGKCKHGSQRCKDCGKGYCEHGRQKRQ